MVREHYRGVAGSLILGNALLRWGSGRGGGGSQRPRHSATQGTSAYSHECRVIVTKCSLYRQQLSTAARLRTPAPEAVGVLFPFRKVMSEWPSLRA
jgi:hypothetical protein